MENIDHPDYYGGESTYETIKVIDAWGLGFSLGNAVKYISRAGKKDENTKYADLLKAIWYIEHELGLTHSKYGDVIKADPADNKELKEIGELLRDYYECPMKQTASFSYALLDKIKDIVLKSGAVR